MKAFSRVVISAALAPCLVVQAYFISTVPTTRQLRLQQTAAAGDDVIARARENAGMPDVLEPPQIFDDDLLLDMQQALLIMEKRVQEGPGSLTLNEVEALGARLDRIVHEMKQNENSPSIKPSSVNSNSAVAAVTPSATPLSSSMDQLMEDDNESYDGKGGMGQPRGTVNTYIIEGMEDMDSETYRLALQQSIIDIQQERRRSGKVGNRGSIDYLSSLGGSTDRKIMFDPKEKIKPKDISQ